MNLKAMLKNQFQDHLPPFYQSISVNSKDVATGLYGKIAQWDSRNPILIDAGTGCGKNTWVLKDIIPNAIKKNQNVLYVSNRVALSLQQKKLLMKEINSPLNGLLTDKGILEQEDFGNVKIITYHKLKSFFENPDTKEWCENLRYVILDEAHFFAADSIFNQWCEYYLTQIPIKFHKAIRIYMTATSWDILYPLSKSELKNYVPPIKPYIHPCIEPRRFLRYYFPRDFKRYILKFFNDIADLQRIIDSMPNDKWIIFVDSKSIGKALIERYKEDAEYIDADKKASVTWSSIVNNEKFNKRLLITTSVIDCGVNINDPKVRNVAIMTDNRTSLIQMIGRKRLTSNERLTVWVHDIDKKEAEKRYKFYKGLLFWYEKFNECTNKADFYNLTTKIWHANNTQLFKLFTIKEGKLYKNELAEFQLMRRTEFLRKIVDNKTTFRLEVQSWLCKEEASPEDNIQKLTLFCEEHLKEFLDDTKFSKLRMLIVDACESRGYIEAQPTRAPNLGDRALNNRFNKLNLPYQIFRYNQKWCLKKL